MSNHADSNSPTKCRCGAPLISRCEQDSEVCDACDARNIEKIERRLARDRISRLRCTECDSVLLSEEEEANMMCGVCLEKSA